MATIAQNLQTLITNKANIKGAIEEKKGSSITSNMEEWSNIIMNLPENSSAAYLGDHVDEDGIWHKPSDWPDIESIELPEDEDVVYLLYGNHLHEYAFAAFIVYNRQVSGHRTIIDKGTVSNGVFTVTQNLYNGTTNNYTHREMLCDSEDDYTIYRIICPLGITNVVTANMPAANNTYGYVGNSADNTCLMRYGQMKWGNNPTFRSYFIESDNIINLGQGYTTPQNVTWQNIYNSNYRMQRWRHTGWAINTGLKFNGTSFPYGFFYYCHMLSDLDGNFDGWVTSSVSGSALYNAFSNCYSIRYLDVSNWDVSNITNMSNTFINCWNLFKIKGLDTWTQLSSCVTLANIFSNCWRLTGDFDLENFGITNKCASISAIFYGCINVKSISIKGWNLSKVTACNSAFAGCFKLKSFNMDNIVPITSVCTNCGAFLSSTYSLMTPVIFDGWDFSGCTANGTCYNLVMYSRTPLIKFQNCTFPASPSWTTSSYPLIQYNYFAETIDLSGFDCSVYTNIQFNYMCQQNYNLINFYPPQNINGKAFAISTNHKISHDSILRIFNNLQTVTGSPKITMGNFNLTKMTAAEIAIATNKGWVVSAS